MRRLFTLVAALAAALTMASVGEALAGSPTDPNLHDTVYGVVGGLRYASESQPFDPSNQGFAETEAGCGPQTWHLLGGGAAAGGGGTLSWLAFNRPDDYLDADSNPDDGFLASGFGPGGQSYTSYSICINGGQIQYRNTNVPTQPSADRTGTAMCSTESWHVTSGSAAIATTRSWLASSFPVDSGDAGTLPDDGWRATAHDTIGGSGGYSVWAICAQGLTRRYVQAGPTTVAVGAVTTATVSCGSDHVLGGGAMVNGTPGKARLVVSAPYDGTDADHIPDDGWQTRVFNVTGASKQVTSFAICIVS